MRSKQRDSLPDISGRKGNRSVRASNFELSSSANDFDSTSNQRQSVATKSMATKSKPIANNNSATNNANKPDSKKPDDKVLEILKMDSVEQENYRLVHLMVILLLALLNEIENRAEQMIFDSI